MAKRSRFNIDVPFSPSKQSITSNFPSKKNSVFSPSNVGQLTDASSYASPNASKIKLFKKPTRKVSNFLTSREETQETDDDFAHEFLIGEMIQNKMKERKIRKFGRRDEDGGRHEEEEEEGGRKENAYLEEVPTNFLKGEFNYDRNFKQVFKSFLDGKVGVDSLLDIKNFPNIFEYNPKSPNHLSPRKIAETTTRVRKPKKITFVGFETERMIPIPSSSSPYLPLSSIPSFLPNNSSSIQLLPPSTPSSILPSFLLQNMPFLPPPSSSNSPANPSSSLPLTLSSSHPLLASPALLKEEGRRIGGSFLKTITNRYDFPSAVQHFGKIKNIIKQRIMLKKKIKKEAFQTNEWNVKFFQNLYSITKEYIEKIKKKDLVTVNTSKNYYDKDIPTGNRLLKDFTLLNYMKNPSNQGKTSEKGINNLIFKDYLKLNAESFLNLLDPKVQRQTKTKKSYISVPHLSHFLKKNIKGMEDMNSPRTEGGGEGAGVGRGGKSGAGEGGGRGGGRKEERGGRRDDDEKRKEEGGKKEKGVKKEEGGWEKEEGGGRKEEGREGGWKGGRTGMHYNQSQMAEEDGMSPKNNKRISLLGFSKNKRISLAGEGGTPRTNESGGEKRKDEGGNNEGGGGHKNEGGGKREEGGGRREEGGGRKEEGGGRREEGGGRKEEGGGRKEEGGGRKEDGGGRREEGKRERSSILQPVTSLTKRDQKLKEYINYKEDLDFFTKYKGCFQPEELIFINELSKIDILDDEYIARTLENMNKGESDLFKIFPALKAKVKYENSIREHEEKKRLKAIKQPIKPNPAQRYYHIKRNNLLDDSLSDNRHDLSEDDTSLPSLTEATLDNLYSESLEIQKKIIRKKDSGFAPRIKQFMKLEEISSIVEETNRQKLK